MTRERGGRVSSYRCLCMRALKAMPSFQLVVKFVMLTLGYLQVTIGKSFQLAYVPSDSWLQQ